MVLVVVNCIWLRVVVGLGAGGFWFDSFTILCIGWLLDACISVSAGICGVLMACFSWLRMLVWVD